MRIVSLIASAMGIIRALGFEKHLVGRSLECDFPDVKSLNKAASIACIEWFDPFMAGGNWVPELVEMLGDKDHCGVSGKRSSWMN